MISRLRPLALTAALVAPLASFAFLVNAGASELSRPSQKLQIFTGEAAKAHIAFRGVRDPQFKARWERHRARLLNKGWKSTGIVMGYKMPDPKAPPKLTLLERLREQLLPTAHAYEMDYYGYEGDMEFWDVEGSEGAWSEDGGRYEPDSQFADAEFDVEMDASDSEDTAEVTWSDVELPSASGWSTSPKSDKTWAGIGCSDQTAIGLYIRRAVLRETGIGAAIGAGWAFYATGPGGVIAGAVTGAAATFVAYNELYVFESLYTCYGPGLSSQLIPHQLMPIKEGDSAICHI